MPRVENSLRTSDRVLNLIGDFRHGKFFFCILYIYKRFPFLFVIFCYLFISFSCTSLTHFLFVAVGVFHVLLCKYRRVKSGRSGTDRFDIHI